MLGRGKVASLKSRDRTRAKKILVGSVRSFGGDYTITARMIDPGSTNVEFIVTEEAGSREGLGNACERISRKISNKVGELK